MSESAVATAPDAESSRTELSSPDHDTKQPSSTFNQPGSLPRNRRRIQFRPRRSTVLIVLATALFATAAIVALTLVHRVQTDPLQVGASQVARLSVDPEFDAPAALSSDGARELLAYQDFYGLGTVIQEASDVGSNDECMTIYQPELMSEI